MNKTKIVLTALFLILIVVLGYFLINENRKNKDNNMNQLDLLIKERESEVEGWSNYKDQEESFVISYPSDWKEEEIKEIDFAAQRVDSQETVFLENFHLKIWKDKSSVNLQDFANEFYNDQINTYSNLDFTEKGDGVLDQLEEGKSYWIDFTFRNGNEEIYSLNIFIAVQEDIYQLNFYTIPERVDKYWQVFDQITRSLAVYK